MPRLFPRPAPRTTTPSTKKRRPSKARAVETSPEPRASRTRVLLTGAPSRRTGSTACTRKPMRLPKRASSSRSPSRPRPKRKLRPTTTACAPRAPRRTSAAKSSALLAASSGVKADAEKVNAEGEDPAFCERVSALGARSGASTRAGWGSNVSATAVPPPATATAVATRDWWPR
jgi:hypothetical protein